MNNRWVDNGEYDLGVKPDGTPYNFFIIDDMVYMVNTIQNMIENFGARVVGTATTSQSAITQLFKNQHLIDVVTLDIRMKDDDGLSLLPAIKRINPDFKIIIISAFGFADMVVKAQQAGVDHFILKPFRREQAYRIIKSVLDK